MERRCRQPIAFIVAFTLLEISFILSKLNRIIERLQNTEKLHVFSLS